MVKPALIDTDILSLFFRGHPVVTAWFDAYTKTHSQINISIITSYEILSGLKHRDAHRQLAVFLKFSAQNRVCPLTEASVARSADIYAVMRKQGTPIDDIDILIAGVALEHDWVLVSRNVRHFARIEDLVVEDWTMNEVNAS